MENNNIVSVIVPLYRGKKYVSSILEMIEENRKELAEEMSMDVELVFVYVARIVPR